VELISSQLPIYIYFLSKQRFDKGKKHIFLHRDCSNGGTGFGLLVVVGGRCACVSCRPCGRGCYDEEVMDSRIR